MYKFRFPVDLQYFSMGDDASFGGGGSEPTPTLDANQSGGELGGAGAEPKTNPLLQQGIFVEDGQQQFVDTQPPTLEELDFSGRKVPVTDPTVKDLHRDWQELNRFAQQANQRAIETQRQYEQQQQQLQYMTMLMQQQMAQQQQAQAQPQMSPEEIAERNQQFLDSLWENPIETIDRHTNTRVQEALERQRQEFMQMVQPIVAERSFNENFNQLKQRYGDITPYIDEMRQVLAEQPYLEQLPNALEQTFLIARGRVAQTPPPTIDDLLANPQTRDQVLKNEQIRQQIVNDYMRNVQQRQQSAPPVMGGATTGLAQTPIAPQNRPKTIQEASKGFREFLRTQRTQ